MFKPDQPIENRKDDILNRSPFSDALSNAIKEWENKESLVISLNGKWGTGKTSIINLVKETLTQEDKAPTLISFNPWEFSNADITSKFFNEISAQLKLKNENKRDMILAKQFKKYASLLDIIPSVEDTMSFSQVLLIILGIVGITADRIISLIIPYPKKTSFIIFIVCFFLLLAGLIKTIFKKISAYFEAKVSDKSYSIDEEKTSIEKNLIKRNKKLLIIIDDIDRLTPAEMNEVFRLIRANANFPNTIYLLAYDKEIIENSIGDYLKVNGKEYLEKIVQVNLDLPLRYQSKVQQYLFSELDRILSLLPEKSSVYFDKDSYWANIYNSGFKDYFVTIRDVKRYINGLEFSIKQLIHYNVLEVNPVDFFALESIRIFAPEFYKFLKHEKLLFTTTELNYIGSGTKLREERKNKISIAFEEVSLEQREKTKKIVFELFPQVKGDVDGFENTSYGHEWQEIWEKTLRICATNCFDQYFTLIPGGDEEEISQFEIEKICSLANTQTSLETEIRKYIESKRIRKLLKKMLPYTSDTELIPPTNYGNIILTLFNVSDILPETEESMWDFGIDMDLQRVIFHLLKNTKDKSSNNNLIAKLIPLSQGIIGPIRFISLETPKKDEKYDESKFVLDTSKIDELQKLCVENLKKSNFENLIKHKDLAYILFAWKEWGEASDLSKFLEFTVKPENLLSIIKAFISTTRSQGMFDYSFKKTDYFNKKNFEVFYNYNEIKEKIQEMKDLDEESNKLVKLFLNPKENQFPDEDEV